MKEVNEIRNIINLLIDYTENFAWLDFTDRFFKLEDEEEILEDALALASVKIIMPKGSQLHLILADSVAKFLRCKWVTYPWLTNIIARIMICGSLEDFKDMLTLSLAVKSR